MQKEDIDIAQDVCFGLPNVIGVGEGKKVKDGVQTNQDAILVFVIKKVPTAQLLPEQEIPKDIEGIPVDVIEIGEVKALANLQMHDLPSKHNKS